jgi:PhzF family phenazine biosynthesis protein
MKLKIYQIDAFCDEVFKGNYAAVIIVEEWLSVELMQSIASENNLSETAFVKIIDETHYQIRWFSPLNEIDFCGHASLASAFVLFKEKSHLTEINFFAEAVGDFKVNKHHDDLISMAFPIMMPESVDEIPNDLLAGLTIRPKEVLRNSQAYFALYDNEQDVIQVKSDALALIKLAPFDVVVTSKADKSSVYDFISRYFWPANGGDEDPVTGSIHTGLAPLWAKRLNKNNLKAYQASKRGGVLQCKVIGNKIEISGTAVQYLEGIISF